MKTRPLTFLFALTFLFLFSGSSVVFGNDLQDGLGAYDRGDYKEAVKWLLKAAEQGDARAQYDLGVKYHRGPGPPQDLKKAVKWYRLSAEQGFAKGQHYLGVMLYGGGRGVPRDKKKAIKWLLKAAEQRSVGAQRLLGAIFYYGQGVCSRLC